MTEVEEIVRLKGEVERLRVALDSALGDKQIEDTLEQARAEIKWLRAVLRTKESWTEMWARPFDWSKYDDPSP